MIRTAELFAVLMPLAVFAGCSSDPGGGPSSAMGGAKSTGGSTSSTGGATNTGTGTGTGTGTTTTGGTVSSTGGAAVTTGGMTASGGSSGGTSAGGNTAAGGALGGAGMGTSGGGTTSAGGASNSGGSAGTIGTGGSSISGGAANTGGSSTTGGTGTTGGVAGNGGTAGKGGSTGTGGSGVTVSPTCKAPTWPTATGSPVTVSGTQKVTTYDGKGALHEGTLNDCSAGNQSSTDPMFEVADGGSVKNVIFGKKVGDGIHCLGSCTIENVWFQYVCDDAITMLGGSGKTMTISNSGFKGARDKTIQHNGTGSTVNINNVYVETAGKLYRSCGDGCSGGARTVNISNVVAIGVDQIAGVSTNDKATLTNICAYRSSTLCDTYQPGSETKATNGANGTNEGPSANCIYKGSDSHALVDRIAGGVASDVLCTGANSAKSGSTATACVSGFETCLKPCAPGGYGFKQLSCVSNKYSETACVGPKDSVVAGHLASSNTSSATSSVTKNSACTTEWAWARDASSTTNYCVCVMKPGYYQESSGWFVWDCQAQWW